MSNGLGIRSFPSLDDVNVFRVERYVRYGGCAHETSRIVREHDSRILFRENCERGTHERDPVEITGGTNLKIL